MVGSSRPNVRDVPGRCPKPQMVEQEDDPHYERDTAHKDVGHPEEGVLAPQAGCGGQNDLFGGFELINIVVVLNPKLIILIMGKSIGKRRAFSVVNSSVEFSEVG